MLTSVLPQSSAGFLNSASAEVKPVSAEPLQVESPAQIGTSSSPSAVFIRSERYQALEQRGVVESSAVTASEKATGVDPVSDSATRAQRTSGTILGFIEAQLQADLENGATPEALESRLQAGLEGFKQGFAEAAQQLEEMGLMTPELSAELQQTYDNLLAGADELQSQFVEGRGVEGHAVAGASDKSAEQDFRFSLATTEGAQVNVQATSLKSSIYQNSLSQSILGQLQGVETLLDYSETSERYALSVDGTLSESDLTSVGRLLDQFAGLSDKFASEGGAEAFEYAQSLGYSGQEIGQFVQNMNHSSVQRVQQAYGQVQSQAGNDVSNLTDSLKSLSSFAQGLQETSELAADFQRPDELLVQLSQIFDREGESGLQQLTASLLAK